MAVYKDVQRKTWYESAAYRDSTGKAVVHTKRGFETKREAQNYETDFRKGLNPSASQSITYHEIVEKFLENKKGTANADSIHEYRHVADLFLTPLYSRKFSAIKSKDYITIRSSILDSDYSKSYKNKAITLLKSISRFAYNFYDFKDQTKMLSKLSGNSDDKKDMQVWTPEQFDQFIEHVDSYTFKAYFTLLFRTGLRRSEGKALLKTDLKNGILTIDKSIRSNASGFRPLKNVSSRRKIQLDEQMVEMLNPLLKPPGRFLFGNDEPVGISSIQRQFVDGIAKCNKELTKKDLPLLPVIRVHDLRHSHASNLISKGANIVAVSKRLGHSDVNMTLKIYTHLMKESEENLMSILKTF
jgi:integrase